MDVRWTLAALLLAACGFEHGQGASSDATVVDVPPATGDQDNDGIKNEVDNCPVVANANQRDHDGDGRGDACDKCPHINTGAAEPDADADGVGDACDPRPTMAGDKQVLFEGFTDASSADTWIRTGPAPWSVLNGAVEQTDPNTGDSLIAPMPQFQKLYAATSFKLLGLPTGKGGSSAGMCIGVATGQYYCCTVANGGMSLKASSSMGPAATSTWSGTFDVGDRIDIVESLASGHRCDAKQGTLSANVSDTAGGTAGQVELYTGASAAAFDYVFLVEVGN